MKKLAGAALVFAIVAGGLFCFIAGGVALGNLVRWATGSFAMGAASIVAGMVGCVAAIAYLLDKDAP